MPANSNALTQNAQGRWDLTLKHDKPNVNLQIPARLTYDGIQVTTTITNVERTINTDWYTELGVPINPDDIDKYAQPVTKDGKTYIVTGWSFDVEPYNDSGTTAETIYSVEVLPKTASITSNGHVSLTSYYVGKQGDTEVNRINVTNVATWSSNNNYVIVNGGSVSGNNTSSSTTRSSRVTAAYSGKSGYCDVTVGKASGSTVTYQLVVTPSASEIDATGETQLLATFYTITDGNWDAGIDVTNSCTWASSDESFATVLKGKVTGRNESSEQGKTVTITASFNNETGTAAVTVSPREQEDEITYKLAVVAQNESITHDGTTQLYGTYQKYINGIHDPSSDISPSQTAILWEITSGNEFASVNNEGVLTASNDTDSQKTVVVKGTYEGATGSTSVVVASNSGGEVVIPVLVVSAQEQVLEQNEEIQLTATYYEKVGDELGPGTDVTNSCTWASDKPDHISVSENGLAKNISVWHEDVAALVTATYISPIGECEGTITLTGKAKEYYAVFADTQNTTSSGAGQVTGFTVSANTTYHFEYSSDWLVGSGIEDGTSGGDTEGEPGGKRRVYMDKTANPLTTKRYNTITIVPHWGEGDEHTLEQERGMSTIVATGSVNNLSYEEQGVNVEVTSNQRWHVSSFGDMSGMNYTNGVSYGEDKPFGPEKEFESGYTRLYLMVPENATTGDVTHSITVQTIDSPAYTASSTYSFTQGPRPVDNGTIFFSKTNSGNGSKEISYKDEDHQAKEANAQSFTFYVRTNTVCSVSVIDQGLELYDWEGNPIHGGRSAGQFFGPTDADGIVWKPITAKIPVNPAAQWTERKRSFMFSAETIDRQTLDFNRHDKACMVVEQLGFRVITDNYHLETFLPEVTGETEEGVWEGPTAVTISSNSQYIEPTVVVVADQWFTSYPRDEFPDRVSRVVVTDYLDETESGYDANLGKIHINPSQNVINHINIDNTHSGSEGLNHSALYPFKIYVSPNQSQAGTGDPIDFDLTLTYNDHDCTESKTIHYTQEHGKIVRPDLDMYVFVPVQNGGTGTQVKKDNSNVYEISGQKYVDFKLIYNGNLTPTYNLHVDGDESENVYITDESLNEYFRSTHTWPSNQTEVGIQVKLKNDLDEEFDIVVEAEAGSQTVGPETTLTVHVKLVN